MIDLGKVTPWAIAACITLCLWGLVDITLSVARWFGW